MKSKAMPEQRENYTTVCGSWLLQKFLMDSPATGEIAQNSGYVNVLRYSRS